jgi:hypothetical protein
LVKATLAVKRAVESYCQRDDGAFDGQLADYVFFPISHVLRLCQKKPGRLGEVATACVKLLLKHGWTRSIDLKLAQQLLILLTVFAGGGNSDIGVSEELQLEALESLSYLFKDIRHVPGGSVAVTDISTIPALGQCLSTILDGVTDGPTSSIQAAGLEALEALWLCVESQQALSKFLPGTVSALTKALLPSTKQSRVSKVLIRGLQVFTQVLIPVIGDLQTVSVKEDDHDALLPEKGQPKLTKAWLKATAGQIKLALGNIVKLQSHNSAAVQEELGRACLVLLDNCNSTLEEALPLLIETAMKCSSNNQSADMSSLKDLAVVHPAVAKHIKEIAYNWTTSLPRVFEFNSEEAKITALQDIQKSQSLLGSLGIGSNVMYDALAEAMMSAISTTVQQPTGQPITDLQSTYSTSLESAESGSTQLGRQFDPIVLAHDSQAKTRDEFNDLIRAIGSPDMQLRMAKQMVQNIPDSSDIQSLPPLLLAFKLLKAAVQNANELDTFLDFSDASAGDEDFVVEGLYGKAVTILQGDEGDWRVTAVALEIIAFTSQRLKDQFIPDLVDVLYPVVQLLPVANSQLRKHVNITLDTMAIACGYGNTSSLILENVDYLVNSIALKLTTFDISPRTPRVLSMMIKLSGPSLLPFLDDVVESIFAALDNFHGYGALVVELFTVLGEVVKAGSESERKSITDSSRTMHKKHKIEGPSLFDVVKALQKLQESTHQRSDGSEPEDYEDFPRKPWKDAKTLLDEREMAEAGETEDGDAERPVPSTSTDVQPATKTYTMVERIARLSQHYLTNPSPELRLHLLNLLTTASGALSQNEDHFLPLVNDVWPVVAKRLQDAEPFVVIGAANAIGRICEAAGDFTSTRIQAEWSGFLKQFQSLKGKAMVEKARKHTRGGHSVTIQLWESMVGLAIAILEHVRISDSMFDELLEVMADQLDRAELREAFEVLNADAVWLVDLECGRVECRVPPVLEGYDFASVAV